MPPPVQQQGEFCYMKGKLSSLKFIIGLMIGLSLLLYPSFSNYWNELHQSRAISKYVERIENLDESESERIWQNAVEYNQQLYSNGEAEGYDNQLNPVGNGLMGYIEIPVLGEVLPIYHSTNEDVLQIAIGHLDWTSLPVGGENTHCILSGHRGLPSARLFTDLDRLEEGDLFMIRVLDTLMTYEVDTIQIVKPYETNNLYIEQGKDLCTLVTCTPYGVNTHRLLVTGHRVDNQAETEVIRVTSDAMLVNPHIVALCIGIPLALTMVIVLTKLDTDKKRKNIINNFFTDE